MLANHDGRHVRRSTMSERATRSVLAWLTVCGVFLLCCGCANAEGEDTATAVSPIPTAEPVETPRSSPSPKPTPSPTKTAKPPPPPEPETDPSFETCREAIEEGFGPYVEDADPEYDWYDDRDGDGVVCEESDADDEQEPAEEPEPESATDPRFDTCREANDAGYGPYVRGQDPEYDWYQDRDDDGIVCET